MIAAASARPRAALPIAEAVTLSRPRWVRSSGAPGPAIPLAIAALFSFTISSGIDPDRGLLSGFACPLRAVAGIPCLGCGGTHAFVHLARAPAALLHGALASAGHEARLALQANPLAALAAGALWLLGLLSLAQLAGLRWTLALPAISTRRQRSLRFALALALAINWAFVAQQG